MSFRRLIQPNLIVSICIIIGAFGGIIAGVPLLINVIFIVIGIFGSLYSLGISAEKEKQVDYLLEAQATLLSNAGIGNIYVKAFEAELRKTGSCKKASQILTKALDVNPNDKYAMLYLSATYALNLSFRQWAGDKRNAEYEKIVADTKMLAEKGIKLYPEEHGFHDALGIILDVERKHEEARQEFLRSGELRTDPYWRKLLSTSWLMSGKPGKAVEQIEKAINEGADLKIIDLYYGRSLAANGDYKKAEKYLLSAFKSRGWRPELLDEIQKFYFLKGQWIKSARWSAKEGLSFLWSGRIKGFLYLAGSSITVCFGILCKISKFLWPFLRRRPRLRKCLFFIPSPDQPELGISARLIEMGHYEAAADILQKFCEIISDQAYCFANLAICLSKQGNKNEALAAIEQAIKLKPKDEKLKYNREQIKMGTIEELKSGETILME